MRLLGRVLGSAWLVALVATSAAGAAVADQLQVVDVNASAAPGARIVVATPAQFSGRTLTSAEFLATQGGTTIPVQATPIPPASRRVALVIDNGDGIDQHTFDLERGAATELIRRLDNGTWVAVLASVTPFGVQAPTQDRAKAVATLTTLKRGGLRRLDAAAGVAASLVQPGTPITKRVVVFSGAAGGGLDGVAAVPGGRLDVVSVAGGVSPTIPLAGIRVLTAGTNLTATVDGIASQLTGQYELALQTRPPSTQPIDLTLVADGRTFSARVDVPALTATTVVPPTSAPTAPAPTTVATHDDLVSSPGFLVFLAVDAAAIALLLLSLALRRHHRKSRHRPVRSRPAPPTREEEPAPVLAAEGGAVEAPESAPPGREETTRAEPEREVKPARASGAVAGLSSPLEVLASVATVAVAQQEAPAEPEEEPVAEPEEEPAPEAEDEPVCEPEQGRVAEELASAPEPEEESAELEPEEETAPVAEEAPVSAPEEPVAEEVAAEPEPEEEPAAEAEEATVPEPEQEPAAQAEQVTSASEPDEAIAPEPEEEPALEPEPVEAVATAIGLAAATAPAEATAPVDDDVQLEGHVLVAWRRDDATETRPRRRRTSLVDLALVDDGWHHETDIDTDSEPVDAIEPDDVALTERAHPIHSTIARHDPDSDLRAEPSVPPTPGTRPPGRPAVIRRYLIGAVPSPPDHNGSYAEWPRAFSGVADTTTEPRRPSGSTRS